MSVVKGYRITIRGTVQGVGFRPFVYKTAQALGICGEVYNDTQGVVVRLQTSRETLERFVRRLYRELPPLARIDALHTVEDETVPSYASFTIRASSSTGVHSAGIPPDVAMCASCNNELFDPSDRRYLYPFISCTQCGPRYTIIESLPYDRPNTSMRFFAMCDACRREYTDPLDRRYHAQPIGCWECGPKLSLWSEENALDVTPKETVAAASQQLLAGHILAVKGVGGYHLMCDATDETVVKRLRERKRRPHKPLAVMVNDVQTARLLAHVSEKEEALLLSKERPIVLLQAKRDAHRYIAMQSVAPGLDRIGLFLPYTPLHKLLMHYCDRPLVATSANVSDEPICTTYAALRTLQGVFDDVLEHDRPIVNGCDDSVVTVVAGRKVTLRRARGYAPTSVTLPYALARRTLALGAHQKSTVAVGFDNQVILSPHIGDLNGIASVAYYEKNIETLKRIYDFEPEAIVHDKHPRYASTQLADRLLASDGTLRAYGVQHHHAHILGVMAEKGLSDTVFGVVFDGTGYGEDGALWGGEFLVCDRSGYTRVAHLRYLKLLGGEKAIKQPRRVALSLLFERYGEAALGMDNPTVRAFSDAELRTAYTMWRNDLNAPPSSSMGRLFDAVASLLGVCQTMSFEGQSGMMLETLFDATIEGRYPFAYEEGTIDTVPMVDAILDESDPKVAATKFFRTVVAMIERVYADYADLPLVVSGGVFQNRVLLELLWQRFPEAIAPNDFPPNDGGIALGQAVFNPTLN